LHANAHRLFLLLWLRGWCHATRQTTLLALRHPLRAGVV
jgi:hypothetical protein